MLLFGIISFANILNNVHPHPVYIETPTFLVSSTFLAFIFFWIFLRCLFVTFLKPVFFTCSYHANAFILFRTFCDPIRLFCNIPRCVLITKKLCKILFLFRGVQLSYGQYIWNKNINSCTNIYIYLKYVARRSRCINYWKRT